jgi:hypothetical protein
LATPRWPLKWIDHPLLDQYVAVSVEYAEQNPAGLPEPATLERLRAYEDELVAAVGEEALLAIVETSAGTRTFHLYADSATPIASERARSWASRTPGAHAGVSLDPGWRAVRRFS